MMSLLTSSTNNNFDVVIVGAGLTGLVAAYSILERNVGLRILIIEKNDMVGGRILREGESRAFFGNNYQSNVTALLDRLEIPTESPNDRNFNAQTFTFLTDTSGPLKETSSLVSGQVYHFLKSVSSFYISRDNKKLPINKCREKELCPVFSPINSIDFPKLDAASKKIAHKIYSSNEEKEQLGNTSVHRLIKRTIIFSRARAICDSLLRACCPGIESLERVSALWFLTMLNGAGGLFGKLSSVLDAERRFFVDGGFVRVVKTLERKIMADGGAIRSSENVLRIERSGNGVLVITDSNRFKCNCVVIAVPPPSNARIILETRLPEHLLDSQNNYQEEKSLFFCAEYSEAYWSASTSLIVGKKPPPSLGIIYDASREETIRVLAGFSSSKSVSETLVALERCFRTRRVNGFTSFGTTSCASINVLRPCPVKYHLNPMLVSLDRTLLAASEFASSWPGTADGAIEAGTRVGRSVLSWTRPQALKASEITTTAATTTTTTAYTGPFVSISSIAEPEEGIARAHAIFLALNVSLFFLLLKNAYDYTI